MPRHNHRLFGPASGGAMTSCGGGATEFYNLSGSTGNPISERLQHDGKLQPGSPIIIAPPGGQPGVFGRDKDRKVVPPTVGGITSTTSSPTVSGGGGYGGGGGGGFAGGGGRPTK